MKTLTVTEKYELDILTKRIKKAERRIASGKNVDHENDVIRRLNERIHMMRSAA